MKMKLKFTQNSPYSVTKCRLFPCLCNFLRRQPKREIKDRPRFFFFFFFTFATTASQHHSCCFLVESVQYDLSAGSVTQGERINVIILAENKCPMSVCLHIQSSPAQRVRRLNRNISVSAFYCNDCESIRHLSSF